MGKKLFIAEKPSVAGEFAKVLKADGSKANGYIENDNVIVTWCVGHLVTMSYPEAYDPALKLWKAETIPFLPKNYKYEVIKSVEKQFNIVKKLLNRKDVDTIYVCTDSGREGEYIYRLVDQLAEVPSTKDKRRVWIDSQTEEEIIRGIKEAKPLSEYNSLSDAAYLRAKEDYLMGINFSRALTLKYGQTLQNFLREDKRGAISVGRVMTCVLGIVVRREREIRQFVKTPFYRVIGKFDIGCEIDGEFKAAGKSKYLNNPIMYKENGFRELVHARGLIEELGGSNEFNVLSPADAPDSKYVEGHSCENVVSVIDSIEKKSEKKNPPLLFNLAELQNTCSNAFKISPDETLKIVQDLYERKLCTYPRTDARVLSTAVAKEITKNIQGVGRFDIYKGFANNILNSKSYEKIVKSRYVNDSQITDHYAIIPTGDGLTNLKDLSELHKKVYDKIVRRFLSIFYPQAVYQKVSIGFNIADEFFGANFKMLKEAGYLEVVGSKDLEPKEKTDKKNEEEEDKGDDGEEMLDESLFEKVSALKKGMQIPVNQMIIKAGETAPPKRYNSGSLILTMEKAGQFIEDEELRAQIKGSGIGTSATRAEILNKLVKIEYLKLNKKTQIITPTIKGEAVYEVVDASIKSLLNAELTASWEKGLNYVADGEISEQEYMVKLEGFVTKWTEYVKQNNYSAFLNNKFREFAQYYK